MDGGFACPECGGEISLAGLSPGRQVRCGWCRTWVEVPFIPRADQVQTLRRLRDRARRRRWPVWAKVSVVVLAVAILLASAWRVARTRWRRVESETVARLVVSSREAEKSGRLGEALADLEGALSVARALKPSPENFEELRSARDLLARREAESQLAALDSEGAAEDPGRSVGRALTLLARLGKDPALGGLEPSIRETLERQRIRWADADLVASETAFQAGQPTRALEPCQRSYRTAAELAPAVRRRLQTRATEAASRIIQRHGTTFALPVGQFTLGNAEAYQRLMEPPLKEALRGTGYLCKPADPLWDDLWATLAPFHVTIEVRERQTGTYLQSHNRLTAIEATVALVRENRRIWTGTPIARTQVPLPGLPAYQASRYSLSPHPMPEFERMLYEDAREGLLRQFGSYLRLIPACPKPAP